jgi:hypothetical protein
METVFWVVAFSTEVKFTYVSDRPEYEKNTSETSVNFTRLHSATAQLTAIFVLADVGTPSLNKDCDSDIMSSAKAVCFVKKATIDAVVSVVIAVVYIVSSSFLV